MSNFFCQDCQKMIVDGPDWYVTGCPHFPLEKEKTPEFPEYFKQIFNLK